MRNFLKTSISLLLILILTIGMSVPVQAQTSFIVTEILGNDPDMGDMCVGYKIDNVNNIKVGEPYTLPECDYHFTITKKVIDGVEYFDWTSDVPVTYIFVKGGPFGNLFTYDRPEMSGTDLYPPLNKADQPPEISHITFYVCGEEDDPSIDIEKLIWNGEAFVDADTITGPHLMSDPVFKFVVQNTGNVTLDDIEFWDVPAIDDFFDDPELSEPFLLPDTLAPGAGFTCYGTMDWEEGQQSDMAYVVGSPPEGLDVSDSDPAHYFGDTDINPEPLIDIEKLVWNGATFEDADTVTGPYLTSAPVFKFIVTNKGNVSLEDIEFWDVPAIDDFFDDQALSDPFDLPDSLAPGGSFTCYGTMEWARGQQSDTAHVTGSPPEGEDVTDTDPAHYFGQDASINITKYVWNGEGFEDANTATGPLLTSDPVFKFEVVNNGNVTLTNIVFRDDPVIANFFDDRALTDPFVPPTTLAPGAGFVCYGTLAWNGGQQMDTAHITGTPPKGANVSDSDPAHYYGSGPSISIKKYIWGGDGYEDANTPTGPSITKDPIFKFVVLNNGNVTLNNIKFWDDPAIATFYSDDDSDDLFILPASLAPGAGFTCYGTMAWAAGQQVDTAHVEGTPSEGPAVSDSDPAHYFGPSPSIDIEKYVWNGESFEDADTATGPHLMSDPVFKFEVNNNGNVTLTNIEFRDDPVIANFFNNQELTVPFVLPTYLPPGAGFICYGTMDWAEGQQSDTAFVEGTPPEGRDASDSDPAFYYGHDFTPRATIDIEKYVSVDGGETWHDADSPTGPTIRLPGTVRFKVIVTNTGNVDLTNIVVTDPDFEFTGVATTLDAGDHDESNVISVSAERGQHSNTAAVNAKYAEKAITPDSDMAHYYGDYERRDNDDPDISIKKYVSADGGTTWDDAENAPGPKASFPGTVQFKVVVKNTGDYRLTDIEVTDSDFTFTGVASTLSVGDSDTSDIITVDTIDGQHSNTAEVEGFYGSQKVTDSDMAHYFTKDDDEENGRIKLHKFMDENQNGTQDVGEFHMDNVTFELYNADKSELLSSKQTDNEGNLTFTNLEFGTYQLKEMTEYDITTSGFENGFMQITVNSEETITILIGNDTDRELESDNIVIIEEPVPLALPKTGELPPTSFYILGALLMLAGMFLKRFE